MADIEKPKYQKLKEYIIDTIKQEKLKPNDKIYSENELSSKFNISRHTVRQAIGELVNEGWLYRIKGKGTFVLKKGKLKDKKTNTIAILTTYLNDYIFPSIIRGIDRILSQNGYNIIISCTYNMHENERICLENLKDKNIDGLIVEPTKSALPNPNIDLYREIYDNGIPIIFIHGSYRNLNFSNIVEDDIKAGLLATEHLIKLGHRNIAGIFKIDDLQGHLRYEGFQKAHINQNIKLSDSKIFWFNTNDTEFKLDKKYDLQIGNLLKASTAVVCYNDQIALSVLNIARDLNISIPNDLSIVSFDDSELATASEIKLTTVSHPKEMLGEEAARNIIDMIENDKNSIFKKMEPNLICRNSTKRV